MLVNSLAKSINSRSQAAIIYLSKAFDKVPHNRLSLTLCKYGIYRKYILWIESFQRGRTQRVVLDGEISSLCYILSGVPHGSVIGPALFLIFINDIVNSISSGIPVLADD